MAIGDPGSGILDPSNPLSFAFGGGAAPQSLEEIKRRRAVAAALAGQRRPFPKNIGEGLTSLGEAVGERISDNRLAAAEQAYTTGRAADPLLRPPGVSAPQTPGVSPVPPPAGTRSDVVDPATQRANIAALLTPNAAVPGVPPANPTVTESDSSPTTFPAAAPGGQPDDVWEARKGAIGGIESGGRKDPYRTVGVPTKYGPALGRYGVVVANVGPWTQAALGQALTPQQFLADPKAQDAVFQHRFGQYVNRFGEEGAARAWFGGPGNVNKPDKTDAHGRLTIATYGQDYLRRLQGRGGQPSGAGDDSSGSETVTIDAATGAEPNPPTPTTIRPMRVAEAGGIPGPLTPPIAVPPPPTVGRTATDPRFARPANEPPQPVRDEKPTPEELRGMAIIMKYPGDETAQAMAKQLIDFGKARREADYQRQVEVYKLKYGTHEKDELAWREFQRNQPKTELELRTGEQALATKTREEEDRQRLGGVAPEVFSRGIEKSYEKVQGLPAATHALAAARRNLIEGKMFTGADAEIQLSAAKLKAAAGFPVDPRIRATEEFRSNIAPIIAASRAALAGNVNISDADMRAAAQAAAGDIKLDRDSIKNVLEQIERVNVINAVEHQRKILTFAGNDENRQRALSAFMLPMEQVVPQEAVDLLRRGADNPAVLKEFDETFHTPGLARKILQSNRGR